MSHPYRDNGQVYLRRGWFPLPLPHSAKAPPPTGWTGYSGAYPDGPQVFEWGETSRGAGNIALRLSETVLGLDLDAYDGRAGLATMEDACSRLGNLPRTWRSTSRAANDQHSGIRLYRVPPGRRWADTLGPGVEVVHHGHRYVVAPPSTHPEGRIYEWFGPDGLPCEIPYVDDLPDLPGAWVLELDRSAVSADTQRPHLAWSDVSAWLNERGSGEPCRYVARLVADLEQQLNGLGSRHDAARNRIMRIVRAADQGHHGASTGLALAEELLRATRPLSDPQEFARMVSWAVTNCVVEPTPESDRGCCPVAQVIEVERPSRAADTPTSERRRLALDLIDDLRTWQHLPDPAHIVATLAAAATRDEDGEACWLLMVAPPSSGKTEAGRLLDDYADARLNEVTAAGLLGWSKGRNARPIGVLSRIGSRGLVTFGDLSSLLATSDRGGRDQVFGLLRRVYDGHATRDVSPPGKSDEHVLEWSGRLTVIACVTGAIDRYSAHNDELGSRWIYLRLPGWGTDAKRRASRLARRGRLAEHRKRAVEAATALLAHTPSPLPELNDTVADIIEDAALVTTWGRGAVPRDGYGKREIIGTPTVEEPPRVVQQLDMLARGVLGLGLGDEAAAFIAQRAALDSMPATRRAVLAALATGEQLSSAACARAAGLDRKVARMALEDLELIGVVGHDGPTDDGEGDERRPAGRWSLAGEDGDLVAEAFSRFARARRGWDEMWGPIPTLPQEENRNNSVAALPVGQLPTLRPTPGPAAPAVDSALDPVRGALGGELIGVRHDI